MVEKDSVYKSTGMSVRIEMCQMAADQNVQGMIAIDRAQNHCSHTRSPLKEYSKRQTK